jgi:hypothetical protein
MAASAVGRVLGDIADHTSTANLTMTSCTPTVMDEILLKSFAELEKCIESSFSESEWSALGYVRYQDKLIVYLNGKVCSVAVG